MGCFVVNCMASGLPIPRDTETVVLFVTPASRGEHHRGGCYVHDMFNFISFPMFLTMDDYGLSSYFNHFENAEKAYGIKNMADLTDQLAWKLFVPHFQMKPGEENKYNELMREAYWGKAGYARIAPTFVEPFKPTTAISPVALTYYRKDVWDWLIARNQESSEFEEQLREILAVWDKPKIDWMETRHEIPWADFLNRDLQSLITSGHTDFIKIDKRQRKKLVAMLIDMYRFCHGLGIIGQPILPSVSLCGQEHYHNEFYRQQLMDFQAFSLDTIRNDVNEHIEDWS